MDSSSSVSVDLRRVQKLLDALSLASIEAFEDARLAIEPEGEGPFALLEETVRLFVRELGVAHAERTAVVVELQAQRTLLESKLRTIEEQQTSIQMLSTPVLELDDDVLTLPIIGAVDAARASVMTDALLDRARRTGARFVIVDVTGASLLDQQTADHLKKMVHAARLLGSTTVLAGMGPQLAMTAVRHQVELEGVPAFRGLKEALRYCRRRIDTDAAASAATADRGGASHG